MITVTCNSCRKRFTVSAAAAGLSADCPHCGAEVDVPLPRRTEAIPFDMSTPPAPREVTVAPVPVAARPGGADEIALDDQLRGALDPTVSLKRRPDAIAPPSLPFGRDVCNTARILFRGRNRWLLLKILIADAVMWASVVAGLILFPLAMPALLPLSWNISLGMRACRAAVEGEEDKRLVVIREGAWEDLCKPPFWFVASLWVAFLPLWAYYGVLAMTSVARPPMGVDWALVGVGLYLWPATMLLLAVGETTAAMKPLNVVRVAVAAWKPYLAVWLILATITAGAAVVIQMIDQAVETLSGALAAIYLIFVVASVAYVMVMRLIGLLYAHFKDVLPFEAE